MALAVGDRVYLDASSGLRADPPLFGVVDIVGGTTPNDVKINWENGIQEFFASATATARLIEIDTDNNADQYVGFWVNTEGGPGQVMRSFLAVDSGNARTFLVRTDSGYFVVGVFTELFPNRQLPLTRDGEAI